MNWITTKDATPLSEHVVLGYFTCFAHLGQADAWALCYWSQKTNSWFEYCDMTTNYGFDGDEAPEFWIDLDDIPLDKVERVPFKPTITIAAYCRERHAKIRIKYGTEREALYPLPKLIKAELRSLQNFAKQNPVVAQRCLKTLIRDLETALAQTKTLNQELVTEIQL